ncbi:MAG: VCBS repeat-containing protein [Bdellovibrionales bacterium]|nr:VCBS repeat-containing protein [Bdellovibrionales bacterium]
MSYKKTKTITLFWISIASVLWAQSFIDGEPSIFKRQDISVTGALRELSLEKVIPGGGDELVVLERTGKYPHWQVDLSIYRFSDNRVKPLKKLSIPADTLFYGFISNTSKNQSALVLVRPKELEVLFSKDSTWNDVKNVKIPLSSGFEVNQDGLARPIDYQFENGGATFFVPVRTGIDVFKLSDSMVTFDGHYQIPPMAYYLSSSESMALDIPFWVRASFWFPSPVRGMLKNSNHVLLFPWMDEVFIQPIAYKEKSKRFVFQRLSEDEREDGQTQVVTHALDLNGDGRTDFLMNKFKGAATSLTAETTLHLTANDGSIDASGLRLQPEGNRAAGAVAIDLNQDGKMELAVASSQFNAWAIARALTQRQVKVMFSFYFYHERGYQLSRPDFTREILFGFDLSDLDIDGVLPILTGDFNGDGYPDALYARNRKRLTILIQKPKSKDVFPDVPSGEYDVQVLRKIRIGDLNGDGKSDIVMYDRKSRFNKKFTVLLNAGKFK